MFSGATPAFIIRPFYLSLLNIFEELAQEMKHPTPQALAQTLLLLVDGTFTSAQIMGDIDMFERARSAAKVLIEL